jgi:hypothetical protein
MSANPCVRRTLAIGELSVIEQCSCGSVHVTIGAVTLRLAASAIAPLAAAMNEAARTLVLEQALRQHAAHGEELS